jgi:hypothetical protein
MGAVIPALGGNLKDPPPRVNQEQQIQFVTDPSATKLLSCYSRLQQASVGWILHDAAGPTSSPCTRAGRRITRAQASTRHRRWLLLCSSSSRADRRRACTSPGSATTRFSATRKRISGTSTMRVIPLEMVRSHRPLASISMERQWRSNGGRTRKRKLATKRRDWKGNGPWPTGPKTGP